MDKLTVKLLGRFDGTSQTWIGLYGDPGDDQLNVDAVYAPINGIGPGRLRPGHEHRQYHVVDHGDIHC